jgi:hypothetical protein
MNKSLFEKSLDDMQAQQSTSLGTRGAEAGEQRKAYEGELAKVNAEIERLRQVLQVSILSRFGQRLMDEG